MKREMMRWARNLCDIPEKYAMPVLSFPGLTLTGDTLLDAIHNSDIQARGLKAVADRCKMAAACSMMDLSVEAELFGSRLHYADDIVPTIVGSLITNQQEADALKVPKVGYGRTQIFLDAVTKAASLIEDRPVLSGILAPYTLAGRLVDIVTLSKACRKEKRLVHTVLEKITEFQINFVKAYKAAGGNGVLLAEPLAGLLGPEQNKEFSVDYCKKIVDAVQDDSFVCVYHNCGQSVVTHRQAFEMGCVGYHYGNAVDMKDMLKMCPSDVCCMGNIDPVAHFTYGTPEGIYNATMDLMKECCPKHTNFVISSGCDIPEQARWENIDAFFKAVDDYYGR